METDRESTGIFHQISGELSSLRDDSFNDQIGSARKEIREFKSSRNGRGSSSHGGVRSSTDDTDFARTLNS